MKNESFRFLPEYANHKRRYVKEYAWCTSKEECQAKLEEIDRILYLATHGFIILDEAMRLLSNV